MTEFGNYFVNFECALETEKVRNFINLSNRGNVLVESVKTL